MFTAITLDPKSVAMFASEARFNTTEKRDYAIELVTDTQSAIDFVCETDRISELSDETVVDFRFQSNGLDWIGSIWVSVYDDLPGCPCEINCSVTAPIANSDPDSPFPGQAYESFDLVSVSGYSRPDVHGIKRELQTKEVEAYVKGYASGQESMARGFHCEPKKGNLNA